MKIDVVTGRVGDHPQLKLIGDTEKHFHRVVLSNFVGASPLKPTGDGRMSADLITKVLKSETVTCEALSNQRVLLQKCSIRDQTRVPRISPRSFKLKNSAAPQLRKSNQEDRHSSSLIPSDHVLIPALIPEQSLLSPPEKMYFGARVSPVSPNTRSEKSCHLSPKTSSPHSPRAAALQNFHPLPLKVKSLFTRC